MLPVSVPQPSPITAGEPTARVLDPRARSFFRRSTIQTRLTVAFWSVGAMSLIGTVLAIWQIGQLQDHALAELRAGRLAGELHAAASANSVRAQVLAAASNPAVAEMLVPEFRATGERLAQLHRQLEESVNDAGGSALLQQASARAAAYQQAYRLALDSRRGGEDPEPARLRELGEAAAAYVAATRAAMDSHGGGAQAEAALQDQVGRARRLLLVVFVLLTLATIPFVTALLVHTLKPMYVAVRIARKVADGDLTVKVRTGGTDEMARLMLALDDMTGNLRRIVSQVLRGAAAVAGTTAQVRRGHLDLSQRTETQASTLQQTASSIEELTATVAQNAAHARQASELAGGAVEVARKGGDVVQQVVRSMGGLSASARRIEEISGLIDGIAFQTNILALNAAVEAARAGDHGRGFAVVAAEVRTLAQRTAAAAREIKSLSVESVGQAGDGTRLVDAAGRTMEEIAASVGRVNQLIADIAAASDEQRAGIEQVNTAIAQMDQVVQQNAALVDETSHSTEALHTQSEALLRAVAQFKLDGGAQGVAAQTSVGDGGNGWMALPGTIAWKEAP